MGEVSYRTSTDPRLIFFEEHIAQVVDQLPDLFCFPAVLALIIVNRVLHALKQLTDALRFTIDRSHLDPL